MTDFEMAEAERFAQALEAIEALAEPDLDPREDPTLFSLAALAAEIHDAEQAATNSAGFRSYCERSRTYVLNRLGAGRVTEQVDDRAPRDDRQPFFIFRWNVLTPVFSAAATAVLVLAFVAMQPDPMPQESVAVVQPVAPVEEPVGLQVTVPDPLPVMDERPPAPKDIPVRTVEPRPYIEDPIYIYEDEIGATTPTTPTTPTAPTAPTAPTVPPPVDLGPVPPGQEAVYAARVVELEIERIDALITAIAHNVLADEPVDPEMLRAMTESVALVAEQLEARPDVVSKQQVISFLTATAHGRTLLAAAREDDENGRALGAARRAAQDGVVVASLYIREHY
jgi:hypothetical protein